MYQLAPLVHLQNHSGLLILCIAQPYASGSTLPRSSNVVSALQCLHSVYIDLHNMQVQVSALAEQYRPVGWHALTLSLH